MSGEIVFFKTMRQGKKKKKKSHSQNKRPLFCSVLLAQPLRTSFKLPVIDSVASEQELKEDLMLHGEIGFFLTEAFFNVSPRGADAASDQSHNRRSVVHLASGWPPLGLTGWMWTFKSKTHTRRYTHIHTCALGYAQEGMKAGREAQMDKSVHIKKKKKRQRWLFIIETLCHARDLWVTPLTRLSHKQITQVERPCLQQSGCSDRALSHFQPRC